MITEEMKEPSISLKQHRKFIFMMEIEVLFIETPAVLLDSCSRKYQLNFVLFFGNEIKVSFNLSISQSFAMKQTINSNVPWTNCEMKTPRHFQEEQVSQFQCGFDNYMLSGLSLRFSYKKYFLHFLQTAMTFSCLLLNKLCQGQTRGKK